jgi:hypothetical protein
MGVPTMSVPNQHIKPDIRLELTTPDGETFELNVPPTRFVTNMRGWGLSSRTIDTIKQPFYHGERPLSVNINVRTINLTLCHPGCNQSQLWSHKGTLIDYLRENRTPVNYVSPSQLTLYYRENGVYKARTLDVFFTGGLVFEAPESVGNHFTIMEDVEFTAYNPIIYDPTAQIYALTPCTRTLIVPFTFPFTLGTNKASGTLTYTGTWESYPLINVTGPAKDFSILNTATDKRLNFWGEVASDEIVTFDLSEHQKTVTNNYGADLLDKVSGNISTFVIQVAPLVTGGANTIEVYSDIYGGTTRFEFEYFNRYRGI